MPQTPSYQPWPGIPIPASLPDALVITSVPVGVGFASPVQSAELAIGGTFSGSPLEGEPVYAPVPTLGLAWSM